MARRTRQTAIIRLRFDQKLVLFQWMLKLFEVRSFEDLAAELKAPELEGFDEENISRYYHILRARLFSREKLTNDMLLAYDNNIVSHWKKITEKRNLDGYPLYPKYFQYLSLLFTEIYLDRYFSDKNQLLSDLNTFVDDFNRDKAEINQVENYKVEDLNKIAFWSATGSGKTLLMHINILQYKHYLEKHGKQRDLNRILLLTPNEGLSIQHLGEFELSNMRADLFSKDGGASLFSGRDIEIIDIHKLREESGDKTVAVEAFEGNNLVLVDEGHRGTASESKEWMNRRKALCENGFSFEYSATFGQAVRAANDKILESTYTKCILLDYSYKYFYHDGYGKDYRILNLDDDHDEVFRKRYLTACLLAFYQQQKLYANKKIELRKFLIDKPLWIFVGGSVNAVRTENRRQVSDVVDILLFLAEFVSNREESLVFIRELLAGHGEIRDGVGRDIFRNAFTYINSLRMGEERIYADIMAILFNATTPASLHIENLKGSDGEIALRLGENDPFGVINVGDTSKLCKLCEEHPEMVVVEQEFSGSLFHAINDEDSPINVLIGSKKFTEGWSSWRVSTMGLMNIGRTEGSQIIQLFGRGVRLKGFEFCLKRSHRIIGCKPPESIETLETLNIFGIRADYMKQFKEYLEEEGLSSNENREEIILPIIKNLGGKKLKMIRLKEGVDFKKQGTKPTLDIPDEKTFRGQIVLDWYPKVQALSSKKSVDEGDGKERNIEHFRDEHLAFMNLDSIYFQMQKFKNERAWYNLNLSKGNIQRILTDNTWYQIYIPSDEFQIRSFEQVCRWEEIAIGLLKKYCDRYYKICKSAFEHEHLEYVDMSEEDPNFINEYLFMIDQSRKDIIENLREIKSIIEAGALKEAEFKKLEFEFSGIKSLTFANHLYQPLIYVNSELIEVKPIVLQTASERDFVIHLKEFCENNPGYFENKEMYLLRNMSRGRGIGFFEAGNFYPDYIIWQLHEGKQYISFVDPKGLRHSSEYDPKIEFYKTIKELESDLSKQEKDVVLNSFIISATPYLELSGKWNMRKADFEKCHVYFQQEDKAIYIEKILSKSIEEKEHK
jgi:hypothetical protein